MGPNAVQDPNALLQALRSQQPAANPKTPSERINPDSEVLERLKAAQVSLDRAKAFTNDEHMLAVFDVIQGTLKRALLKFDGQEVLQSLVTDVQSLSPMLAAAPGSQPPPMPGPQGPMGAPPSGVPGQPGAPL